MAPSVHARIGLFVLAAGAMVTLGRQVPSAQSATPPVAPTFTKDIAPILQKHCQSCHRPDSVAPMSLITYADARPWARSIKTRTGLGPRAGVMPPWYVDKAIGIQRYDNDPSLSDAQIHTIAKWVDAGAPEGSPADMPPALTFNDDWRIGTPDLIVKGPIVEMPAIGSDRWGTTGEEIPTGLAEDRYVAALQAREVTVSIDNGEKDPRTVGGKFIIHHWTFNSMAPGSEVGQLGTPGTGVAHEVGRNEDVFDVEAGRLMKAGSVIRFGGIHLHPNGRRTQAQLEIGLKFHPKGWKPVRAVRERGMFGNSYNLDIRPMEANQKFEAFTVVSENARIVSFEPHMHAAAVRMCLDAIYGTGTTVETLSCVGYDHSWVRKYNFSRDAQPLVPRGTILRLTGYFDNTPANRNVADPRNWSGNGHRSIDNMMNELGETHLLTDKEFEEAMAERRQKLGLREGETVIGCPLCGVVNRMPAPTQTSSRQQQQ